MEEMEDDGEVYQSEREQRRRESSRRDRAVEYRWCIYRIDGRVASGVGFVIVPVRCPEIAVS